jgi:hypothetical protein
LPEGDEAMWAGAMKYTDGSCNRDVYFNENGYEEKITDYDLQNRQEITSKVIAYDSSNQRIREEVHHPMKELNEGSGITSFSYQYDAQGRVIQTIGVSDKKETVHITTEYNHSGQVAKQVFRGYTSMEFTYDEKGRKAGYRRYRDDGTLFSESAFKYDDKDRVTWHAYKNTEQQTTEITTREYNQRGDVLTETIESAATKKTTRFNYEYDAQGNWTRKSISPEDRPVIVVERSLEYYP